MQKSIRRFMLGCLFVLPGCGGGSSIATPGAEPAALAGAAKSSVAVSFVVPARGAQGKRLPNTISPATQSVGVAVAGGSSVYVNVPGPGTYSVNVGAPIGNDTFVATAYISPGGAGSALNSGTVTQAITAAGPNNVTITMLGVAYSVTPALSMTSAGPPQIWNVAYTSIDASSTALSGPIANPLTVSFSDPSITLSPSVINTGSGSLNLSYNVTGYAGACNSTLFSIAGNFLTAQTFSFMKGNKTAWTTGDAGLGTLRQALSTITGGDTIALNINQPIALASTLGSITLAGTAYLCGQSPSALTVNGAGAGNSGMLQINGGGTLNLQNMTIANFRNTANGGAINANGAALNATNVVFSNNQSLASFSGGAIEAGFSSLIINCVFSNNSSSGTGGAIDVQAATTISRSTFNGNSSSSALGGGAVRTVSPLNISASTFSGNTATAGSGGALALNSTVSLNNVTLTSNTSPAGSGGAIYVAGGNLSLTMSTVYGNTQSTLGQITNAGSATLQQSIIAGSSQDLNGSFTSNDYNIYTTQAAGAVTGVTAHNIVGPFSSLGPLSANAGNVPTMRPTGGGAIDAIPSGMCASAADAIGTLRGVDGFCDIGAFET